MNVAPWLSVVVPVFNEEATLRELIRRTVAACRQLSVTYELILVDDGSHDDSVALLEEAVEQYGSNVIAVLLNRNYGQHAALLAGFGEARGEHVVTLDADLQNPPEEIPRIVAKLEEGFDVVGTVRRNRQDSLMRRLASRLTNRMVRRATGVTMHDYGCMLRGYRRNVVRAMLSCPERSTFIPVLANAFARHTTEIDVDHSERASGESKYSFWKLINLQFDLLTTMTTAPLRMLTIVGGLISFFGIGFGTFLLVMRLVYGSEWAVGGVFTLFAILFTFVGAQFMAMGLLGEYLGRVYHDVRARPRAFVDRVLGRDPSQTFVIPAPTSSRPAEPSASHSPMTSNTGDSR